MACKQVSHYVDYAINIIKANHYWHTYCDRYNQATGMTKISRGGIFGQGGGGILVFQLRGVYTPLEKPEVRLLALFGP